MLENPPLISIHSSVRRRWNIAPRFIARERIGYNVVAIVSDMAAQSKLVLPERSLKKAVAQLTTLYIKNRTRISRAVYLTLLVALVNRVRHAISEQKAASAREASKRRTGTTSSEGADVTAKKKVELNRDVKVAEMDGAIVKALVKGNGREFLMRIMWWMLIAMPATFTNSMLSYHQAELSLKYRTRLTQHIHDKYLSQLTFYGISALDDRIKNPDQLIAVDVAKFSNSLAELYSNLAKPLLDMTIYTWSLSKSVGGEGVVFMSLLVQLSAGVMRALTPPFGKYVADEARLEGEFRFQHSRLIDHSEEVALYHGHEAEKDTLDKGYFTLIKHVNYILRRRFYHGVMEDFVIKYFWGALGLLLCSVPVFFKLPGQLAGGVISMGDRTETFVTNRRMLLSASDAFGRIMFSYREIMELAGYTSRVASLLEVMDDLQAGHFEKKLVSSSGTAEHEAVLQGRGKVVESKNIQFIDVPIISPNGDVLVKALSFTLRQGDHLLVVGPNGCGKSSLFRILGGLWPVYGGTVHKPPFSDIFYIPQRPYLSRGGLRQQITYPDSLRTVRSRGVTDAQLMDILKILSLEHLVDLYPEGWDAEAEWRDVLSGGLPARRHGTALLPQAAIRHPRRVYQQRDARDGEDHFDGQGNYVFTKLDADKRLKLEDEKEDLDVLLRQVPEIERRIGELTA
ncbi:ATP-binding cassette- subfamily D (ALD)- member 2 [Apiospora marii]|uniref:ATP-binding cassette- subfamily D (ALD)- member 2 n=1 Tax=Apiospora marii TaxID=335849 RepID=A0ABR1R3F7_9PEZI